MESTSHIRQNRGKHKLLACVPCCVCKETLYPVSLTRYRVRTTSTGFMQAPAFYYSHVECNDKPQGKE